MTRSSSTARNAAPSLSISVEDYLKTIHELEAAFGAAPTNEIAQRLAIAPASVSGMVQRMAAQGWLTYERYRGVRLTDLGRRAALRTVRRHRIIETYLLNALGYSWDEVHEEAERLEHAASEELIDRMATALGNPDQDPHGAPIPSKADVAEPEMPAPTKSALDNTTNSAAKRTAKSAPKRR